MSRTRWARVHLLSGIAILAILIWRLGAGPFVDGIRTVDGLSLTLAAGIAALATICCAWRWSLVARGLGIAVPLGTAIAAYYRSQFLNTTLPGGILGDVHRGVTHGRDAGDVGRGVRAVVWERTAGQVVQAGLAVIVLLALPAPMRWALPAVLGVLVTVAGAAVLLPRVLPRRGSSRWERALGTMDCEIRDGVLARRTWPGVLAASVAVVACHVATFLIAARTAGVTASTAQLLPLAMLVLLAMSIPTNIGGWGPREGVAAWAFGAAGLGAGQGLATAVVYGVLVLVASLPGLAVLFAEWVMRAHQEPDRSDAPAMPEPVAAR